jgi:steroid delta-isomerase-like uncharacterized protein
MAKLISPDYIYHSPFRDIKGPDGLGQLIAMYRAAFPDIHLTIVDIVAEGEKVACCISFQGTFKGEMMGIPPTGKKLVTSEVVFIRFKDGKEVEAFPFSDRLALFQQLGIPIPSQ